MNKFFFSLTLNKYVEHKISFFVSVFNWEVECYGVVCVCWHKMFHVFGYNMELIAVLAYLQFLLFKNTSAEIFCISDVCLFKFPVFLCYC